MVGISKLSLKNKNKRRRIIAKGGKDSLKKKQTPQPYTLGIGCLRGEVIFYFSAKER